jgi:FtsP/CotA-like multicopper oxidase with cupredoxin domain
MSKQARASRGARATVSFAIAVGMLLLARPDALALTLNVQSSDTGNPFAGSFRWLVEEDNTNQVVPPGAMVSDSLSLSIHKSYAPVIAAGTSADLSPLSNPALIQPGARYFISVLPDAGFTLGGAAFEGGQASPVDVIVNPFPVPLAQMRVLVFEDTKAISQAPELPAEKGLPNFSVFLTDILGQQAFDAFNNPLGTTYVPDGMGGYVLDGDGAPVVATPGQGIVTGPDGIAIIGNLAPGSYNVYATPRDGQPWIQSSTLVGGPKVPVVVKAGEPPLLTVGGVLNMHAFLGFLQEFRDLPTGTGTITGRCVLQHADRPPSAKLYNGAPVKDCYVGINSVEAGVETGQLAQAANPDGTFTISSVPAGTWQLVLWDRALRTLMTIRTVPMAPGQTVSLGDIPMGQWFSTLRGSVFRDLNENGIRDPGETGVSGQAINLRYKDASILQATETDSEGNYELTTIPPLGKWLIAEVDFARFKVPGATFTPDEGGAVTPTPQPGTPRTELGIILLEGVIPHASMENIAEWGKTSYGPGPDLIFDTADDENGGIASIVYYSTTRAENDPEFAAGEDWEPGIPRAQTNLYFDLDADGVIDDVNNDGVVGGTLADVDNYPFQWRDVLGGMPGLEDLDRNYPGQVPGVFDAGDAINIYTADSFDDNQPIDCVLPSPFVVHGNAVHKCSENLRVWSQMQPELFDGGAAFVSYFPGGIDAGNPEELLPAGTYIEEVVPPPGYELVKPEDRNVELGDEFKPTPQLLPAKCVGDPWLVPTVLSKDGVTPTGDLGGETVRRCDRKQVTLLPRQNALADFFLFTQVPKAGRIVGQLQNVNAPEMNQDSPNYGGFAGIPFVPVSIRDYLGNEIQRVYADEFGYWNALVPSTHNVHIPAPSGVSPGVVVACANQPPEDPQYNPSFDQQCVPVDVLPGKTSYPVMIVNPIAAVASAPTPVDCEFADGTPVISEVNGSLGPWVPATGTSVTITSPGTVSVPDWQTTGTISRDFGFGTTTGSVTVGGIPLTIDSWSNTSIMVTLPGSVTTGQLLVTRGDNGLVSRVGVTLTVEATAPVDASGYASLQDALDAASPNALVVVPPGTYTENLIISKPIRLQGYGAYSTIIDAGNFSANQADWEARLADLIDNSLVDLVPGQRTDFAQEKGSGILVLAKQGDFGSSPNARIDGLTITKAANGSGIFVNGYAPYVEISNNRLFGNQGQFGGGIRSGWPTLINETSTGYTSSENENISIHHNHFNRNGSLVDGGGMALYKGNDNYVVRENYVCGGYSNFNGAGLSIFGLSPNGVIQGNDFVLNESFGEGGAIGFTGEFVPPDAPDGFLTEGAGSVTVDANLIQANLAGDDGGGISIFSGSGQDVNLNSTDPTQWYSFDFTNNLIVNNIAVFSAGGIALADTVNVRIVNNTIAHNDCTALAAFTAGNPATSTPQGAGIVARPNSPELAALSGEPFADPVLINNILWKNRAFFWDANANGGLGGLDQEPGAKQWWDLQVFGQPAGVGMNPISCVLTSGTTDAHDPSVTYDASNTAADPLLVDPYFNVLEVGPLVIAQTFSPRTVTGDYHISSLSSPAEDAGTSSVLAELGDLGRDYDGDVRPSGFGVDIGADEIVRTIGGPGGPPTDTIGPFVRSLAASPNPTAGAGSVTVSGIAYDTSTGAATIDEAEYSVGASPVAAGSGTPMAAGDGNFDEVEETVTATVPIPGGDFTVWVRAKDSLGNWGAAFAVSVDETAAPAGDTVGPPVTNVSVTPNPTDGAATVTVTGVAYDNLTGGSDIAAVEYSIGLSPAAPGSGLPLMAADATFDEVAEGFTGSIPVPAMATTFVVHVRAQDSAGQWGPASDPILVTVTEAGAASGAGVHVQCPGDTNGDAVVDLANDPHRGDPGLYSYPGNARCMHLSGGDGFVKMADGRDLYIFSFSDLTGTPPSQAIDQGILAANFPAPTIVVDELDEFYLNLTNVSMIVRADLFDPHSIHWHGFPHAASIFDGLPESGLAVGMGSTLTYFYKVIEPGTYMYHCHVEATEHMQMGMLGNLYVRPKQNRLPDDWCFATNQVEVGACAGYKHQNPDYSANRNVDDPLIGDKYAYNDGDGSTRYDVEVPIQIGSMDPAFHDASEGIQPLPFALMEDKYAMLNGRGYPDTMEAGPILNVNSHASQPVNTRIEAQVGQKILLRISNLNVTNFYTLATLGVRMKVVGVNARLYRGPTGKNLYYDTNSVTLGGGEAVDVIVDTAGVPAGTYFLYTTNLNYLSNNEEDFGGMMTEIVINP